MRRLRTIVLGLFLLCSLAPVVTAAEPLALGPAPAGSFSIVVIPDTQGYRGQGTGKKKTQDTNPVTNPAFDRQTQWIVENVARQRIVFVSHTGDIVDKNVVPQWEVARRWMDRLQDKVPYAIAVGNHDMSSDGNSSLFQRYFPVSRFKGFDWYRGTFRPEGSEPVASAGNSNSYQVFSAEGVNFVILHLECNAPDDVLRWADDVLTKHADRRAIIATHMDLGPLDKPKDNRDFVEAPKGRMRWKKSHRDRGNTPQQMWDTCYRKHKNLSFIFSGDQSRTTAMYLTSKGDHGNAVHAMMSDYVSTTILRVYRFLPKENRVQVITLDTQAGTLVERTQHVPRREDHQFSIEYPMSHGQTGRTTP